MSKYPPPPTATEAPTPSPPIQVPPAAAFATDSLRRTAHVVHRTRQREHHVHTDVNVQGRDSAAHVPRHIDASAYISLVAAQVLDLCAGGRAQFAARQVPVVEQLLLPEVDAQPRAARVDELFGVAS